MMSGLQRQIGYFELFIMSVFAKTKQILFYALNLDKVFHFDMLSINQINNEKIFHKI